MFLSNYNFTCFFSLHEQKFPVFFFGSFRLIFSHPILSGILVFLLPITASLMAEEPVRLFDDQVLPITGNRLLVYENRGSAWSPGDVLEMARNGQKGISVRKVPNFGFSDSRYWVIFSITNRAPNANRILEMAYSPMDHIKLYQIHPDEIKLLYQAGDKFPFYQRPRPENSFLFPVTIPQNSTARFMMKFETDGSYQMPLFVHSERSLYDQTRTQSLFQGGYFGILVALTLYNLILYFTTRDRSFFYYFLTISGFGLIVMNLRGMSYHYLWPESSWWENHSLPVFIGMAFFWATQFTRSYLQTPIYSKRIDKILLMMMLAFVFLLILSMISYKHAIIVSAFLVLTYSILTLLTAFQLRMEDYEYTLYYLIAWTSFMIGTSVYSMMGLGLVPTNTFNNFSLEFGSSIQMILLSLGLGRRIRILDQEKDYARAQNTRMELELIKKNLEPHFMMNTINATVHWLQEKPDVAIKLLHALARELRMLIEGSGKTLVPVSWEVELCKTHLEVMKMRRDQNFKLDIVNLNMDEFIPPLIFHTIMENGITHGFEEQPEGTFRIQRNLSDQNSLIYTIENNGNSTGKPGSGLGMKYIESRLEETFPGKWKLVTGPTKNGWRTTIEILVR